MFERFSRAFLLAAALATLLALWASTRLSLSTDLTDLFPRDRESAALARFTRAFGGGDLGLLLVRGPDAGEVKSATLAASEALASRSRVARVIDSARPPRLADPTLAWRHAGPLARARLAHALTDEGMRERLDETRSLLLAPGSSGAEEWLARDPLRLAAVPWETQHELAAGVRAASDDAFVGDMGRARLIALEPRGGAFDARAAASFVSDVDDATATIRAKYPRVTFELTGGHAIARATRGMLERDLVLSGTASLALSSLLFVATFRRTRALLAVLPPLMIGTIWTTGLAALAYGRLSAIAIAFTAVVIGVGVDTGVHVYGALLAARRRGLSAAKAARAARRESAAPTLIAALVAGLAFCSLALSDLAAMRELGVLCGAGELLTAVAILIFTPEIGAWLERREPPPRAEPRWVPWVIALTATRARAGALLASVALAFPLLFFVGWPHASDAVVAVRPGALAPLKVHEEIYRIFGGKPGQWIVLSADSDPERAAARADAVAETLEKLREDRTIDGFDALASYAPSPAAQRARLAERDALDLPRAKERLSRALVASGFSLEACAPALLAFDHPSSEITPLSRDGALAWLAARHLAADGAGALAASYVRPNGDPAKDERALALIAAADPGAVVTGYPYLERSLKRTLAHDLPRIALLALGFVAIALRATLRRGRDVLLALGVLAVELGAVALSMRALSIHWHVYDALVLPVLFGITMDESLFLLRAARSRVGADPLGDALREQGPLVAATALTTAGGFGALLVCRFEGLVDLGAVGAIGSVAGLVAAVLVIPAGVRVLGERE